MKDSFYNHLIDELLNDECPICKAILRSTERQIDYLLYENVNDAGTRTILSNSNGFCEYHSKLMLSHGDPLGHAILYDMVLKKMLHDFLNQQAISFQQDCSLCKTERFNEKALIKSFLSGISEVEFYDKYQKQGFLCMYHLQGIYEMNKMMSQRNDAIKIIEVTLLKYDILLNQLSEIRRKNDYRFSDEPWTEPEKQAWKKVVYLTVDQGKHRR